ncbi:NAD-glutamate dehydrogenase [Nocardia sp. NBC_01503]|uniref:NAD-glutamate dehydrogenase n=1 Tax=Nocardia sp. NBC_01503 TaxID=2975997 RepID=UPI002E7B3A46|nr:NAD-glutamate dehydrogenase [Nocardia sp. NBC_01503]WTL29924.1 NAD-glutamate dehydrogenase [Nocardia sp. NBC_01503]
MVATTLQMLSWQKLREDPADLEAVYFRWIRPDATIALVSDRAGQILRRHLELAESRRPGTAVTRVYRPGDASELGPAIQIVNDDMPLLVDSLSCLLRRFGAAVSEVIHPVFDVLRDNQGRLRGVAPGTGAPREAGRHTIAESWIHVQLGPQTDAALLDRIEHALPDLLAAIRGVARDTAAMTTTLSSVAAALEGAATREHDGEIADHARLLRWLGDGHFTLLGYGYHSATADSETSGPTGSPELLRRAGLGILHDRIAADLDIPAVPAGPPVLRLSSGSLDGVLPGSPDGYIISVADPGTAAPGQPLPMPGTHVFIGTFTVTGQHENILDIPVISRRVHQVMEWAGLRLNSFSGQELLELLQTFPRAELFATDTRRLFETVSAVMDLGLRRQVRLFLRPEPRGGAVYCLVYLPRDRYSTEVRLRMREVLRTEFDGEQVDYSARATESELAVVYFTVHRPVGAAAADVSEESRARIQELLFATTRSWSDLLVAEAARGSEVSPEVAADYAAALPATYRQEFPPARGLADLRRLRPLAEGGIDTQLYRRLGARAGEWRFTLYVHGAEVSLSRVLPILHSLGVEVVDEHPYPLLLADGSRRWIYDFGLRVPTGIDQSDHLPDNDIHGRFADAVTAMWFGGVEVDGLNELVLRAGLDWRQIAILRAYARYLQQAGFAYSFGNITRVLQSHPDIARSCVELFEARFDPDGAGELAALRAFTLEEQLRAAIDAVVSLDTDRILRALLDMIGATLRTSYFRTDRIGGDRDYLSFKFDPRRIPVLPEPRPQFEIFVYSPRVEGVHLRFGAVARGGLRWSDRLGDFRTEILGLAKTQAVKNAVIVPVGAKGGFVVKRPPVATGDPTADRQALQSEGIACYRTFISGLLDLTDNIDRGTGRTVPPPRVVRRDDDDTYLVVAADKGTATFSDIANEVAQRYDFWLGDAFASGGSVGYDHKAMGITARGAWESVQRHFAEMNIDTRTTDFTVVGVGDMSGDVFGNGMLLSRHIRLIAAFDHRHIFLDPNPDAESSFLERERLFALPRSSWADYDRSLISAGGGVYDRAVKAIPITAAVRAALALDPGVAMLSPLELIRAIVKAPAQLLWNGGIGTYIKAAAETNAEVGDKSNDAVRVNANELRVKVIGEGGNLGITALGRIEFSNAGGKCNTDAVDNSAGVDCSDHEVNIKVLLDSVVAAGELSLTERNLLLASMTEEVAELVLRDNISQNFRLGISRAHAPQMAAVHRRLLTRLEGLDRALETLPSDTEMLRRIDAGLGLTSPELANLLAHVKLSLKRELLAGGLPDHPAFAAALPGYFPAPLRERFGVALQRHPLRRQIIATTVVNRVVDYGGTTYVFRLAEEMGVTTEDAVRAFTAVAEIFDLHELWHRIRTTPMPTEVRDELELETKRTLDRASRWVLTNRPQPIAIGADIARYRLGVRALSPMVPAWQQGRIAETLLARSRSAISRGAPRDLAEQVFLLIHRYPLLDVIDIAEVAGRDARDVVSLYYALDQHFDIQRLLDAVVGLERSDRWRTLARLAVRDDLYDSLRALTLDVLTTAATEDSTEDKIAYWESINRSRLVRARAALTEIFATGTLDMATLSVAARQVRGMTGGADSVPATPAALE